MRIIANFHKGEALRFISHLDIQRLLQRALRRACVPVKYSQGFNPHPLLACASALSVGYTSDAEWMDIRMETDIDFQTLPALLNTVLPEGLRVSRVLEIREELPTLTALLAQADYVVNIVFDIPVTEADMQAVLANMLAGEIIVNKRTKGGMKDVDIRPYIISVNYAQTSDPRRAKFEINSVLNAAGGLQMELFLKAFLREAGVNGSWRVHRSSVQFDKIEV